MMKQKKYRRRSKMAKPIKTNVLRQLDALKISYETR